jgi:hypothetical protein
LYFQTDGWMEGEVKPKVFIKTKSLRGEYRV